MGLGFAWYVFLFFVGNRISKYSYWNVVTIAFFRGGRGGGAGLFVVSSCTSVRQMSKG